MSDYKDRYGVWAGNPRGTTPNYNNCAKEVMDKRSMIFHQCRRKKSPNSNFCKQHGKKS